MNVNDSIPILQHLASEPLKIQGCSVFSGFTAALRDARCTTGRDPASGMIMCEENACSWLGAVGYLILLDQIRAGTGCFLSEHARRITVKSRLAFIGEVNLAIFQLVDRGDAFCR